MAGLISILENVYAQTYTRDQAFKLMEAAKMQFVGVQFDWRQVNTGKRVILGVNPVKPKSDNSKK